MIRITVAQVREVYDRRPREQTWERYLEIFTKELKAVQQDDGSYVIDDLIGEYVWTTAVDSKTPEEYFARIMGLKKFIHVVHEVENGVVTNKTVGEPREFLETLSTKKDKS